MIEVSLFSNEYVQDLLGQPAALRDTLQALEAADFMGFRPLAQQLASGTLRRVVLTGMGSSYHALHPLWLTLIARGCPAHMIETGELVHYASGLLDPATLVIAVSQSGRSVETLKLLEQLPDQVLLIAVTNTADSPLARRARACLLTRAGTERTVSCKTYLATLVALAELAEVLTGGVLHPVTRELQSAPALVASYLEAWQAHLETLLARLAGIRFLILAGRGASLAAVGTGGLIVKEAAHFPTEGMSCAAFRHGPLEMALPEAFVLVYAGQARTATLNARLVDDIRAVGGRSALVAQAPAPDVFALPTAPDTVLPLLEILPVQMLSVALAIQHGHTPGRFERATKVTGSE